MPGLADETPGVTGEAVEQQVQRDRVVRAQQFDRRGVERVCVELPSHAGCGALRDPLALGGNAELHQILAQLTPPSLLPASDDAFDDGLPVSLPAALAGGAVACEDLARAEVAVG